MCLSIPFRIRLKNGIDILKDCFGLNESTTINNKNKQKLIIIEQPKKNNENVDLEMGNIIESLKNSDDELDESYDFI